MGLILEEKAFNIHLGISETIQLEWKGGARKLVIKEKTKEF